MPGPYPPIAETNAALTAPGQMFEMAELEIRGVPTRVWKNALPSLVGVLEMSRAHGDKTFLVYEDEQVTFEEFFQQVAALARQLVGRYGVEKGTGWPSPCGIFRNGRSHAGLPQRVRPQHRVRGEAGHDADVGS